MNLINAYNLFKHELNKCINYNFSCIDNNLTKIIIENDPLKKEHKRVKCCLVKKHYHVKGEIIIIQREKADNQFEIITLSCKRRNNYNTKRKSR